MQHFFGLTSYAEAQKAEALYAQLLRRFQDMANENETALQAAQASAEASDIERVLAVETADTDRLMAQADKASLENDLVHLSALFVAVKEELLTRLGLIEQLQRRLLQTAPLPVAVAAE